MQNRSWPKNWQSYIFVPVFGYCILCTVEGCALPHGWMATGTGFLKEGRGGGSGGEAPRGSHKQTELLSGQRTLTPFLAPKVSNKQRLAPNYKVSFVLLHG